MIFWRKKSPNERTPVKVPQATAPAPIAAEPEPIEFTPVVSGGSRKKILVVDDDPVTILALTRKLTSRGFTVISATDGTQALNATRKEHPDLMLVDVNLPPDVGCVEWNGFRLAQWVQRMEGVKSIPVIVMSVANRPEYRDSAMLAGATGFFCKESESEKMLATIDSALRGSEASGKSESAFDI
jgi:CheY-like chemotaxis protein